MSSREYFIEAHVNPYGIRYKLTRNGKGLRSTVNLYIKGQLQKVCKSEKQARKLGQEWSQS